MNRRYFLLGLLGLTVFVRAGKVGAMGLFRKNKEDAQVYPVQFSRAEWKKRLRPEQFYILREEGTERAFSSPLNDEKRAGTFHCAGCDNHVFSSDHKFDSGTGWPSFWQPVRMDAIETTVDRKLFYPRTEEHCATCGGHLGHIFDDGPQPTGLRHCINGAVLVFKEA